LLNWAARYFPIIRLLKNCGVSGDSILELGSGPFGLCHFYNKPLVGCDVRFSSPPQRPMLPVIAAAERLPFGSCSFEAVVASDMLEHVTPHRREAVIWEALRVSRKLAVFGFPCGPQARRVDEKLLEDYKRVDREPPDWLVEHMENPFPVENLFDRLPGGWTARRIGNENVRFHYWMHRKEMRKRWRCLFGLLLNLFPGAVELALRLADREPYYRLIFVVGRTRAYV
jgi:hypothetical protein